MTSVDIPLVVAPEDRMNARAVVAVISNRMSRFSQTIGFDFDYFFSDYTNDDLTRLYVAMWNVNYIVMMHGHFILAPMSDMLIRRGIDINQVERDNRITWE